MTALTAAPKTSERLILLSLKQVADVSFPTRWAHFRLFGFVADALDKETGTGREETAVALVLGDIYRRPPLVRIHSQCMTGDVFHSLRCDCHDQLHLALQKISSEGAGVLVYEHQEGRGIGLMEKLRAYELQDKGLNTIDANLQLGHPVDARNYLLPVAVLHAFRLTSVRLLTSTPEKILAVVSSGIEVTEQMDASVPASQYSAEYLALKRDRMGHMWTGSEPERAVGSAVKR
jgi:GTP cyclohydrolase II